jgi:hypothetical protein
VRDRDAIYGQDFAAMTRDMEMRKCLLRRDSPGKIRLWNDSWAPSDASAWTTLSFGMRDRCVELFAAILPFTSGHVRIWPWAKTPRSPGPWNRWNRGAWLQFLSSGDCTTDTSGAPLSWSKRLRRRLPPERKYRLSWIYPTKLLLIQNRILSRHELPVLGCTRRLGEAETASR